MHAKSFLVALMALLAVLSVTALAQASESSSSSENNIVIESSSVELPPGRDIKIDYTQGVSGAALAGWCVLWCAVYLVVIVVAWIVVAQCGQN